MFMIAGPNGAGKSTLYAKRIAPLTTAPFINADIIQRDELKDASMEASYKAAELAETRRREHLQQGKSFVSESTFSHPSKLELISDAKDAGFRVIVYHVNLRSPELSVNRVEKRFTEGGHNVPENKIRERFERNPALIKAALLQAERGYVYDNSSLNKDPALVMKFKAGKIIEVSDSVPAWARDLYAKELEPFSFARLNPAAASFADVKEIALKNGGDKELVRIPKRGDLYVGEIVGESAMHWLQKTKDDQYIAHFKSTMSGEIELQANYAIKTFNGQSQAVQMPSNFKPEVLPLGSKMEVSEYATAMKKLGEQGRIDMPKSNTSYSGKIIQASESHIVQKIDKNHAIAHDVKQLENGRELMKLASAGQLSGKMMDVKYDGQRGKGAISVVQPEKKSLAVTPKSNLILTQAPKR